MKAKHVNKLLNKFPIEINVKFSYYLENWQKTQCVTTNNKLQPTLQYTKTTLQKNAINLNDIL